MAFTLSTFLPVSAMANSNAPRQYIYKTSDAIAIVVADDYFLSMWQNFAEDDLIIVYSSGAIFTLNIQSTTVATVTTQLYENQELTASGVVLPGVKSIELSHASTAIESTIETALEEPGLFTVVNTSSGGTEAHLCTLSAGTWNGTNTIATLDAPLEAFACWFDSAGNGTILENVGTVGFSGP